MRYGKVAYFTGAVRPGAPVVGVEERSLWQIRTVGPELYRYCTVIVHVHLLSAVMLTGQSFSVVDSPFILELSRDGDKANGTPVVIALDQGAEAQKWRLVAVQGA